MGCIFTKLCLPSLPDKSIRDYWQVDGVILDDQVEGKLLRRPSGIIYVYNGNLEYRSRSCIRNRRSTNITLNICSISSIKSSNKFTSLSNGKCVCDVVVEISLKESSEDLSHVAFISNQADTISNTLRSICEKHRQKPRIFQFNSIDVEGIEIECP
uniref:THAP-type domain-containing protein n=1 Tax=Strongyloides papillosus TaxID=174720 RepID=A0A0N5BZX4_STREA